MVPAKKAVAAKVDPEVKERLETVAEEAGKTVSEVASRGLEYYIETNPDEYEALASKDFIDTMLQELES